MNDLRVLHRTRTQSTHGLIFGASFWIAVATGSIHMKTSKEQKKDANYLRELFSSYIRHARTNGTIRLLCKTRLIFPRINGPILFLRLVVLRCS